MVEPSDRSVQVVLTAVADKDTWVRRVLEVNDISDGTIVATVDLETDHGVDFSRQLFAILLDLGFDLLEDGARFVRLGGARNASRGA